MSTLSYEYSNTCGGYEHISRLDLFFRMPLALLDMHMSVKCVLKIYFMQARVAVCLRSIELCIIRVPFVQDDGSSVLPQ